MRYILCGAMHHSRDWDTNEGVEGDRRKKGATKRSRRRGGQEAEVGGEAGHRRATGGRRGARSCSR